MTTAGNDTNSEGNCKEFLDSLARGLKVITSFDSTRSAMTLSDVARATGLTRAGARRVLLTLRDLDYIQKQDKLFRLAPKVLELGYAYLSSMQLISLAHPFMEELSARVNETCSLVVLDGSHAVYVAKSAATRPPLAKVTVGMRVPAAQSAAGRVLISCASGTIRTGHTTPGQYRAREMSGSRPSTALLAELEEVRKHGYAVHDHEINPGWRLRAVAVPIRNYFGESVAALSVVSEADRCNRDHLVSNILPILRDSAATMRKVISRSPSL